MSMARALLHGRVAGTERSCGARRLLVSDYGTGGVPSASVSGGQWRSSAALRATAAGPGSIADTSPPNEAISFTRLELT